MPKVVRFHELGGPEVLKIEETATPQPGKGEVRLKVQAVGLNRAEAMFFHGNYLEQPKLPSLLGYEAAGVVEAVGPDVDRDWIGKQAAVVPSFSMNSYGLLAEEAVVPALALGEYPAKLSATEGAATWMQYLTAYGALIEIAQIRKDDFVLITAASSSVGLAAIQMVKAEGAVPITTTRTSVKKAELEALGADHVIATEEEDLVARVKEITGGKGARVIFDPVAGPFVEKLAEAAAQSGILIEYGSLSLAPTPLPLFTMFGNRMVIRAYTLFEITGDLAKLKDAKEYVYERLEDGRFQPKIAKTFPFAQTVEAYRYLESNAQVGKVVITVP
ncbi:zinc-dependent alcohol dehydrogenase family protein [Alloacidobacterium sp.]|uniref:zinc-dependent alcohol dehydrogenase family protein n=1 Tax=Alloacidobacterium sp. TaxID=2951999 RepID=UPI002D2E7B00|nr:zinc-dependent alcohol dehydrogenase family protein [Alloacidobacterium sp.]HYK38305.1 zinc-dependent alcohol dehydrogenase family protein [Alloacidobacterium sp.]